MKLNTIWTIGHSTRSLPEFIAILKSFGIEMLADIRHYPGSKRLPHFNKEALETTLPKQHIKYVHFKALGGRRKAKKDSLNTAWRLEAFRGYADYMETGEFKDAASQLGDMARRQRTVYMCAEAVWWSCHRSLLSDYFKAQGWQVMHIMGEGRSEEHPYTSPARIVDGKLSYTEPDLFSE